MSKKSRLICHTDVVIHISASRRSVVETHFKIITITFEWMEWAYIYQNFEEKEKYDAEIWIEMNKTDSLKCKQNRYSCIYIPLQHTNTIKQKRKRK